MKKLIPLLLLVIVAACSSDDNISDSNFKIIRQGLGFASTTPDENGMYKHIFNATVTNSATQDITGHVRFTIKEYGTFNSESGVVPAGNKMEKTFFLSLETEKIIDESYLLKAEFVRE